jgi:hypothetical protein
MNVRLRERAGRLALLGIALVAGLTAQPAAADSVVTVWDEAALQAIRDVKPGPTHVARHLAILHTAIYDAWAAYDAKAVGTRLGGYLRRPVAERTDENKKQAISFAAYRAAVDLFPLQAQVTSFRALMVNLGYNPDDASIDRTTPTGIGNVAAAAVLKFRHADGANQLGDLNGGSPYSDYTGYAPVNTADVINDPNRWQPLRVSDGAGGFVIQKYSAPHWGFVTPFALTSSTQFMPKVKPFLHGSSGYVKQAKACIKESATLTDEKKMTAEYWADGPNSELPPGHWALIAQFVSHRDNYGIDQDVKVFFATMNGVLDAGIACWEAKRIYDYVRPITAIRYLYTGKEIRAWGGPGLGTQTIDGKDWQPYGQPATVISPPFASFYSGHATFSMTAATILRKFTGSDKLGLTVTNEIGSSTIEPGITPTKPVVFKFPTFTSAAKHAGISRIYSAIHFANENTIGQAIGKQVGDAVWEKYLRYVSGEKYP